MKLVKCLILIFLLGSCQNMRQEVEPEQVSKQAVKLVVACFISPQDTILAAKVARSRPILDDETVTNLEVTDAIVTLQAGSRTMALTYNTKLRYYRASPEQFPIRAGEAYQLTVKTRDGQHVEASTTVPVAVDLQRVRLDSELVQSNSTIRKRFFARYFWSDPASHPNYYQTEGVFTYRCPSCVPPETVRKAVEFVNSPATRALYTDQESTDGVMISGNGYLGGSILSTQQFFRDVFAKPLVLTASLLHLNTDFYRYHDALERQQKTDGNPFAEPVLIPSNIRGGLGCFGAYNRSTLTITLK